MAGSSPTSQTLVRGLDVLEMVASGPVALPALADRLGLARSTTHRLATALLERRYLSLMPREGYALGPKLLELGSLAQEQTELLRIARPYLEQLAAESLDTVHLSVCEAGSALLLERIPGYRRLLPSLRIGERARRSACAPGHVLLLDLSEAEWREVFAQDGASAEQDAAARRVCEARFLLRMRQAQARGYACDDFGGEAALLTVAAPVRGADGRVVAALGLSTAAQYLDEAGLAASGEAVREVALSMSADLGRPRTPSVNTGGGNIRVGGTIAVGKPDIPLEAEGARVHDQTLNRSTHAGEPDRGGAHEA